MRITFVVPVLDVSGGARIIAGHAERLAARGHDVFVVAPTPRRPTIKERAKALIGRGESVLPPSESHYLRANLQLEYLSSPGLIREEDFPDADVIIATWWETALWIWPLPPRKGAKVHFVQGYDAYSAQQEEPVNAVWRLPTFKIAVAQWLVDLGRERFGLEEIALVPNSVDHDIFHAVSRQKGERPTVGFLFHEAGFKDMPTTLASIESLKRIAPETQLLSFGAWRPRRGQLPAGTEFHHLPPQHKIAEIYTRCDVWLSTSRREGFNLPPLEAMACGCPVVCSKTGRPLEIVEDGVNGYLVDPGDVNGFCDHLGQIISLSEPTWRSMSDAAMEAVAHPTWEESSLLFEEALVRSMLVRTP